MAVCGVIAEYDPFHRGHERHLLWAREKAGADQVIVVMSGSFTQRGMPALLPAHARAEMALRCGADIVLQLPYAFSVREAEYFALGGVRILTSLGCVTHLSFGCETEDMALLQDAARILEQPDAGLSADLQSGLDGGLSFAAAQGRALEKRLRLSPGALDAPNTALALAYLRALIRLRSPLLPVPILRQQAYHAAELEAYPSASAVRGALLRGDWPGVKASIPEGALPVLRQAVLAGLCRPERFDLPVRLALLQSAPKEIARWPGVDEGLEKRMLRAAEGAATRETLIQRVKTRRYTYGRISRALCHGVMGVGKEDLPSLPRSARILGFREGARPLLRQMQKSGFPLYSRPAREDSAALDARADDLWCVLAGLPRGRTYRQSPVILPEERPTP
ncbi:MAG: nucleotidyltransferase family protein [Clostridiales bacterium]|nr:nucleotidyltransferase family protein [Clostridiales bacterium]